ncbi:NAD-dependent epimerase/dehydratase family protein [Paenibacillus sp. JTLBN-2024]
MLSGKLYEGDLRDKEFSCEMFSPKTTSTRSSILRPIRLSGKAWQKPVKHYDNNVYGTLCLLEAMDAANVRRIVFSSTAATYGEPERVPIQESDWTQPTNVYGETKLMMERMMSWFDQVLGIKYVALRYFNAAGAHDSGKSAKTTVRKAIWFRSCCKRR